MEGLCGKCWWSKVRGGGDVDWPRVVSSLKDQDKKPIESFKERNAMVRGVGQEDDLGVSILGRLQRSTADSSPVCTWIPFCVHSAATPLLRPFFVSKPFKN